MRIARVSQRALVRDAVDDPDPTSRWCTVRQLNGKKVRTFRNFRIGDLRGRPAGHPEITRESNGKARLGDGQVWAEMGTSDLWTIAGLVHREDGELMVALRPYGCNLVLRRLTQPSFRTYFRIWEDAVEYRARVFAGRIDD